MKNAFGGSLLIHKRKSRRPLSFRESTHLILRLKPLLPPLLEPYDHELRTQIYTTAKKYNIRIYDLILNHTHMHAVVMLPSRESYNGFIREVTSRMTAHFSFKLKFLGAKLKKIFTHRPFTRIVHWGKAFKKIKDYMLKNEVESGVVQRLWNLEIASSIHGKHSRSGQLAFAGLEPP